MSASGVAAGVDKSAEVKHGNGFGPEMCSWYVFIFAEAFHRTRGIRLEITSDPTMSPIYKLQHSIFV